LLKRTICCIASMSLHSAGRNFGNLDAGACCRSSVSLASSSASRSLEHPRRSSPRPGSAMRRRACCRRRRRRRRLRWLRCLRSIVRLLLGVLWPHIRCGAGSNPNLNPKPNPNPDPNLNPNLTLTLTLALTLNLNPNLAETPTLTLAPTLTVAACHSPLRRSERKLSTHRLGLEPPSGVGSVRVRNGVT